VPFTRDQLVDLARQSGLECTARLITEWAQFGIIDQPERVGRSDGKRGAYYLWPDTQKDLLLTVLAKRGEVRHIKSLVQVPVGIWMYWGDEWVPMRQVRRALTTSTGLFGPPNSYERALANARDVVRALTREGVSRGEMNELRDELAGQLHRGRIDPEVLRPLIETIAATDPRTGGWGPFGLRVDEIVTWIQATVVAVEQLESVSDGQLRESRARQRFALLNYAKSWRRLAQMPEYGQMFEEPTLELFMNRSCRDLLFNLGVRLVADQDGRELPPVELIDWHQPPLDLMRISASL
jgi:hypothetical protein